MLFYKADNFKLARELAAPYAELDYELYSDGRSAVLVYEADKPYGGNMKLFTGSEEISIVILSEIARIIMERSEA